jgi:ABC-type polysaccharide/polyol phosphate transport system ATPase subunit
VSDAAISVRGLGVRFYIRHLRSPTVHSGIVRFLKRQPPPKEFWALRDVSFEVARGKVLGIIGPNGSGKSTMLRTLARIFAPDEGEIELRGRVSSLISLGAGFQQELSGLENIYYNGVLLGLTKQQIEARKEEIIAFAELGDFIDAPVKTYSMGMRARLGFSVAVHVDPEILLVDEVLVVGDAQFQERCAKKMVELFTRGTTVVMVQHQLEAILQTCHECIWLERGQIQSAGVPYDVVKSYLEARGLPMIAVPESQAALTTPSLPGGFRSSD